MMEWVVVGAYIATAGTELSEPSPRTDLAEVQTGALSLEASDVYQTVVGIAFTSVHEMQNEDRQRLPA